MASCRDAPVQTQVQGAHHEDTQQVHVSVAGAGAAEILVVLQNVPARLQRLPERADIGLPLTELRSQDSPVRHSRGCRMQKFDCYLRPQSRLTLQECTTQGVL